MGGATNVHWLWSRRLNKHYGEFEPWRTSRSPESGIPEHRGDENLEK